MYRTLKCLEKFDKLKLHFSTTTSSVGCFCTRRKIEQFRCRKKSEMVWKWSVYGELCLYIVRSYGHILPNTSINTISPDLTLIYDTGKHKTRLSLVKDNLENVLLQFLDRFSKATQIVVHQVLTPPNICEL